MVRLVSFLTLLAFISYILNTRVRHSLVDSTSAIGGGFVYPAAAQLKWCWDLRKQSHQEQNYAIALLAYSLAPDAQYPAQLAQTVAALRYLVEEKSKDPSKVWSCLSITI